MAKKRVFLDECCSELISVFGEKAHIYTVNDLELRGKEDLRVIDKAFEKKCLIVTVNKDFLDYYRNHPQRKRGVYFYGLIFLKHSSKLTRKQQLRLALKETAWAETRDHDDLITVSAEGKTKHERLCHPECAAVLPKKWSEW
ncbi:MAG TPA: DUF5615 family PIN-like protein [Pseudacidobacterium sp.]|jgi:hypothetical protein|nr:DUF5615 family PIN-like protein [Pseudacidobacterium sp.]